MSIGSDGQGEEWATWGTLTAVRSGSNLPSGLRGHNAQVRDHDGARRGDGWQVCDLADHILDGPDGLLLDVSKETAAPALGADSDYGQLVGVSPGRDACGAWVDRNTAFAFERDHYLNDGIARAEARRMARQMIAGFGSRPAEAARQAVRWAADAGLHRPGRA